MRIEARYHRKPKSSLSCFRKGRFFFKNPIFANFYFIYADNFSIIIIIFLESALYGSVYLELYNPMDISSLSKIEEKN